MSQAPADPTAGPAPWSPEDLHDGLTQLVDAVLLMQGAALLVASQPTVAASWQVEGTKESAVLGNARSGQDVARSEADRCLSVVVPKVITLVSECRGATNLVESTAAHLATAPSAEDARLLLGEVHDALQESQSTMEDLTDELRRRASTITGPLEAAVDAMRALVAEVDSDGWLAKTSSEIDTVREGIQADLEGIYAWRTAFGEAVKGVVLSLVKLVTGASNGEPKDDKKPEPKDGTAKKVEPKDGTDKKADKPSSKGTNAAAAGGSGGTALGAAGTDRDAGFDVKKLDFISDEVAGLRDRLNSLHRHYDRLAELYVALAEEQDIVAVGRAVTDQGQGLLETVRQATDRAESLHTRWRTVLGDAADAGSGADLVRHHMQWRRVQQRLSELERALLT